MNRINNEADYQYFDNNDKWFTKFIREWKIFAIFGVLFILVVGWYISSINSEDKALIKIKESIQNLDSSNQNSLKLIKDYQKLIDIENNNIKLRNEKKEQLKEQLSKIIDKFDIIGLFVTRTYAEESLDNILDKKIVKFCKIYWKDHSKKLQNRCIKLWQAQMRFEVKSCKLKTWNNNCYNFRSISKKNREWFKFKTPLLDKAWFTQFESKTESIKFYAFRFFKYDYKKPVRTIVQDFTHSKEHRDNYTQYIFDYKPTF